MLFVEPWYALILRRKDDEPLAQVLLIFNHRPFGLLLGLERGQSLA